MCRKKPNLRRFLSRKAKFTTFLSQFVAKRKKRIGRKFLVRIYATRKSHRLCQPGVKNASSQIIPMFDSFFCGTDDATKNFDLVLQNFPKLCRLLFIWKTIHSQTRLILAGCLSAKLTENTQRHFLNISHGVRRRSIFVEIYQWWKGSSKF